MKELSIEEKASLYDEAIEKTSKLINEGCLNRMTGEFIFPELKKSEEDDKIRKEIIEYIKTGTYHKSWIAWLEKQSTPQVRTGLEWVNTIDDACDKRYSEEYAHGEYCHEQSFKWGFQEGVDWLEKQGETSPVLSNSSNIGKVEQNTADTYCQEHCKGYQETGRCFADGGCQAKIDNDKKLQQKTKETMSDKPAWSEEDEIRLKHILRLLDVKDDKKYLLMFGLNSLQDLRKDIAWLKSIKDRVQSKQEILEKLEEWLDEYVSDLADVDTSSLICSFTNYLDGKLPKSIRPQSHWKPSEEMLEALYKVIPKNVMEISEDEMLLDKLYQGLKYGRVLSKN